MDNNLLRCIVLQILHITHALHHISVFDSKADLDESSGKKLNDAHAVLKLCGMQLHDICHSIRTYKFIMPIPVRQYYVVPHLNVPGAVVSAFTGATVTKQDIICQPLYPNLYFMLLKLRGYNITIQQVEERVAREVAGLGAERVTQCSLNPLARLVVSRELKIAQKAFRQMQSLECSAERELEEFVCSVSHSLRRLKLNEPSTSADRHDTHALMKRKHRPEVIMEPGSDSEDEDLSKGTGMHVRGGRETKRKHSEDTLTACTAVMASNPHLTHTSEECEGEGSSGGSDTEDLLESFRCKESTATTKAEKFMQEAFAPPAEVTTFLAMLEGSSAESMECVHDGNGRGCPNPDKGKQMPAEITRTLLKWLVTHAQHPYPTNGAYT
jgi:hypothetical protein